MTHRRARKKHTETNNQQKKKILRYDIKDNIDMCQEVLTDLRDCERNYAKHFSVGRREGFEIKPTGH